MASVRGRSCGFCVHLRSCLPPVSSPNYLASASHLASCFFLRFSSASCRNHRLKLRAAPPASGSRVFSVHGETDQEGSSASSPFGLQQSPATRRVSSRKKKLEGGAEVNSSHEAILLDAQSMRASLLEDASSSLLLSAPSKGKILRRKKEVMETLLQASGDSLPGDEKPATSKRTRKKIVLPDISSKDVETISAEERLPSKSLRRRKKCEFEDKVEAIALNEPAASFTSSLSDAVSSTPKRATRKKKTPDVGSTTSLDRKHTASEDKQRPIEGGGNVTCKDKAKPATPVKRARNKKMPSLILAQEESLLQEEQVGPPEETILTDDKPIVSLEANILAVKEIEEEPLSKKRCRVLKAEESTDQITSAGLLSENITPVKVQRRKNKLKEPSVSLKSDQPFAETVTFSSSNVATGKLTPKSTSKVVSSFTHKEKVESTSESYLSHEVRNVENSVDKASLTDEMPVISVTDSHIAFRRRQSEVLGLPKEVGASETSTYTSKALPSILEDSAVKNSGVLEAKKEQIKENESEIFNKANFVNGSNQKRSGGITYEKQDPLSHTSRSNNSRGTFCGQMTPGKYAPGPTWTEKTDQSKGFPVTTQRWAPNKQGNVYRTLEESNQSGEDINSQQWAQWKKSDTMMKEVAKGGAVQENETTFSVQFKTASHNKGGLQQGYDLANMDRAYGKEQKKKKEFSIRKVVANQASTTSYMQILGTGFDTGDTMPTVLLFFDRRRFIFNVGEGLHRFCMEHRFKLSKLDHVFLTRVCSETAGGLPGLILTLAEMGESGLTVQTWGPSSLQHLAQAMRTFVPLGWMEHTHCFGAGKDTRTFIETTSSPPILLLEDELIKISAVLLHSENETGHTAESISSEGKNGGLISSVYICELTTVAGKFDPDKAQAKGLKPSYKYGELQKGRSVMSDDGTIMVHPEDVLGPSSPGPIMFLVDCPSVSHIPSLTSSTSIQSYFSQTGKIVNCMIHIGPRSVTKSKDYQSWMENFKDTHHIMARKEVKVLGTPTLRYSAKVLSKLNLVCPQLFPIVEPDAVDQEEAMNGRVVDGENLLKYRFRPLTDLGPDVTDIPEVFNHVAAQKYWRTENPEVMRAHELAAQVIKRWSQVGSSRSSLEDEGSKDCQNLPACLQHVSRDEMELVFLGTGSSQPAKHRNVTGIYIHMFKKGGIMLDCGEGTYAQLKRRYGAKGADDVLMGLKCIWISHMHADHFSGLARILSARRQLLQAQSVLEPILVVGPNRLKFFLAAYKQVEDLGVEFLDCSQTTLEVQNWINEENSEDRGGTAAHKKAGLVSVSSGGSGMSRMQHFWKRPGFHIQQGIDVAGRESLRRALNLLGLKNLCSVPVVHCPHAFAVVLEAEGRKVSETKTKPGWKLVFSGDTRPCQALVEAARGATILIHEATFDDGLVAEAVKKNHSMTNEAIQVGVAAQVYRIFLTHFSQRYTTIPSFDDRYSDRTCIAFDMMSVNLADLPIVPKLVPALQLLFRDQTEVEDDLAVSV